LTELCLLDAEAFDLRALFEDQVLGIVVEMEPEVNDVSAAHESIEVSLDAVNGTALAGLTIVEELLDSVADRSKVVIIKYIHLIIGETYS